MLRLSSLVALVFCFCTVGLTAELRTEHTWKLEENEARPVATLDDASWLVGSWNGTGFGQRFEETWNPPSAGSMVGLFKLYGDDGVALYEIMLITVEEGVLSLKVKHFNADFSAWEEKQEHVNFRIVKVEENALHFGGLSFYRRGPDKIDGYIVMRNGDEVSEQHLQYTRRSLDD
ncbi:MAG: DUF6265 family protein [Woeseia sp.]